MENQNFKNVLKSFFNIINPGKEFLNNWHLDVICHHLEQVYNGKIKRLIINMPPRALKSFTVNVAWPAWLMGRDPTMRIISASYSNFLSLKHAIDSKLIIESELFKEYFPDFQMSPLMNKREKFMTTKNGFRFSTSIGGSLTGEGGDLLILDDPHNALYVNSTKKRRLVIDWFSQSFTSRLDDKKNGKIVLVMQRLHDDDLTGNLLEKGGDDWFHLNIPSIANKDKIYAINENEQHLYKKGEYLHSEREGKEELDRAKRDLGDAAFAAQYLQQPLQTDDGMVKKSWFKYYDPKEIRCFDSVIISWDTALKTSEYNSYSVGTCWGKIEDNYYLIDLVRKKLEYPDLKREVLFFAEKHNPHVTLIEDKASGQSLLQDFKSDIFMNVKAVSARSDKVVRFARCSQLFEKGSVYFPKEASWLLDYEEELLLFPVAKSDDQVDSTSQYLNYMIDNVVRNDKAGIRML